MIPRPLKRGNGFYYTGPIRRPPWLQDESEQVEEDNHDGNNNEDSASLMKEKSVGNADEDRMGITGYIK